MPDVFPSLLLLVWLICGRFSISSARVIAVGYFASVAVCFFFFSSRRRHTRCSRDWSPDVCSSDLPLRAGRDLRRHHPRARPSGRGDDGGHDDDREQELDLRLPVRPGTDDREPDREQLRGGVARVSPEQCPTGTRARPDADVLGDQRLRATHGVAGVASRGGIGMKLALPFTLPPLRFDREGRRLWKDLAMTAAAFVCVVIALIPLGSILIEAGIRGIQAITPNLFLFDTAYGGIGNAIQGTLILIALSSVSALPIGILTGIYLSEFGKGRVGDGVRFFVDVLTQVPSIVVGIFVYSLFLTLALAGLMSTRSVFTTITGVIALTTIMIPFVARTSEESLRLVPVSTREAALALGIPRYRSILRVVLPSGVSGLVTGALLGVARVAGETAPLLMTAYGSFYGFSGLDQPIESLPHTIYTFALDGSPARLQAAWGASLVLVLIMLVISIVSRAIVHFRSVSE